MVSPRTLPLCVRCVTLFSICFRFLLGPSVLFSFFVLCPCPPFCLLSLVWSLALQLDIGLFIVFYFTSFYSFSSFLPFSILVLLFWGVSFLFFSFFGCTYVGTMGIFLVLCGRKEENERSGTNTRVSSGCWNAWDRGTNVVGVVSGTPVGMWRNLLVHLQYYLQRGWLCGLAVDCHSAGRSAGIRIGAGV